MPIVEGIVTPTSHFVNEHIRAFENLGPFQNHDLAIQKMQELGVFDRKTTEQVIELQDGTRQTKTIVYQNIVDAKWYAYDFENETFVEPKSMLDMLRQASNQVVFDGNDDNINFSNDNGFLDYSKDWSLGITMSPYMVNADNYYTTLFQNGQNRILIRRGGDNSSPYVTYSQATATTGVNTWTSRFVGEKWLITYTASTRKLRIYSSNSPNTAWTITVPTEMWGIPVPTAGEPSGKFIIGKSLTDESNYWNEATYYKPYYGGLNNFIGSDKVLGEIARTQYLSTMVSTVQIDESGNEYVAGDLMLEQDFSSDLTSYCSLGEDVYPNVIDKLEGLTGGTFTGLETGFEILEVI